MNEIFGPVDTYYLFTNHWHDLSEYADRKDSDTYKAQVVEEFCKKYKLEEHAKFLTKYCITNKITLIEILKNFKNQKHSLPKAIREALQGIVYANRF